MEVSFTLILFISTTSNFWINSRNFWIQFQSIQSHEPHENIILAHLYKNIIYNQLKYINVSGQQVLNFSFR